MSRALGRYELLRPLARGGMGEVYLARRRAAGVEKWLVVKRMRPERAGDTRFLDLFMREARLTMSLAHQNIVPVFDFGRIDDQVFLAMERVEGKDLGSSLQKAGAGISPLLAAFVASECLQALDYAHRRKGPDGALLGIVHRDVTPRNVLLSWAGEVKLTDFGIAVLAGDRPDKHAGTPAYMAPEQARGETVDVRADIYAVGLVLREALTGVRARRGNERAGMLELAKAGELDPWPESIAADAPLRVIADKATATDKDARYADARAMLEELDTFIVAERAAKKVDAPARQLAAWLAETWKDAREDEQIDAQIEAGVLVSFLDDGALDVVGTGTQRSALATAAEDSSQPARPPSVEVAADLVEPVPEPTRKAEKTQPVRMLPASGQQRSFVPLVLFIIGAAVVLATIFILARPKNANVAPPVEPPPPPPLATVTLDAAVEQLAMPDAAIAVAVAAPDAGVAEKKPPPVVIKRPPQTGSGSAAVAPPAGKTRKVTINSKPWSNWSVDGGAQHSGLDSVELSPGKHVIHFTGNPYFKADKKVTIDVPDRDGFTHVETL